MIPVIFAQLTSRWGQAVMLLLLSVTITAAAVSVPLFPVAIDRAAAANEYASADPNELVVYFPAMSATRDEAPEHLQAAADVRAELAGFVPVTTVSINVDGLPAEDGVSGPRRLLAMGGFCAYVTFTAGRCPVANREAAVPVALAEATGVEAGDEVVLTPVKRSQDEMAPRWLVDGTPTAITMVGIFEPEQPDDPYWAAQYPLGGRFFGPAIVTNRSTLQAVPHTRQTHLLNAVLPADVLAEAGVEEVRQRFNTADEQVSTVAPAGLGDRLPELLDRIQYQSDQGRAVFPIAVAPLLVLGWFVIYLAVRHGWATRRREAGLVALRGTTRWTRAKAIVAESLLPLLVGIPLGLPIAHLLVPVVTGVGGGVALATDQIIAATLAGTGAVVAALAALRTELAVPVAVLLRGVVPQRQRIPAVEVVIVALGILAVANILTSDGELTGVMLAAPVMIMLAVSVLTARAFSSVVGAAGRRLLQAGRLAPAMAALQLARRSGSARVLVALGLVLATFGFAATTSTVAAEGRSADAHRQLGASRVLDVQSIDRDALLQAVRTADPNGRYAMAVTATSSPAGGPPALAVDSTRLAQVALWSDSYGGPEPAGVHELLHPAAPDPIVIGNGELVAELRPAEDSANDLTFGILLAAPDGESVAVEFGTVASGQQPYQAEVTDCADGCRLAGLVVERANSDELGVETLTVQSLRQDGDNVVPPGRFAETASWRVPERANTVQELVRIEPDGQALRLSVSHSQPDDGYVALAVDAPYPLPVVSAGRLSTDIVTGVDGEPIQIAKQAVLDGLPGIGSAGVLMDLEYAERLTATPGPAWSPQVWLADDAPDEIIDHLRDEGLVFVGDRTVDGVRDSLDESGTALALRYLAITAAVAVLLGLGAFTLTFSVDRTTLGPSLNALRQQGVGGRTPTAAVAWSYFGLVVIAACAAALAAASAWFATSGRLPLGVDKSLLSDWPQWAPVLVPWAAVIVVTLTTAAIGARYVGRSNKKVGS